MGAMEGKDPQQIADKVSTSFGSIFGSHLVVWPAALYVLMRFIDSRHRMLYVNCFGLCWNSLLSFLNNRLDKPRSAR
jgi:hypothetical protein